jgi:hypothetical protein
MTNLNQMAPGCCGGGPFALTAVALAPLAVLVALVLGGVGDPLHVLVGRATPEALRGIRPTGACASGRGGPARLARRTAWTGAKALAS